MLVSSQQIPPSAAVATPAQPGRPHSLKLATALSIALPGAGQAYNGHPFKAMFFLFASPLILTWVWAAFEARSSARKIVAQGGRYGRGGFVWVFLQGWLAFNVTLFVLIVLTIVGVLR